MTPSFLERTRPSNDVRGINRVRVRLVYGLGQALTPIQNIIDRWTRRVAYACDGCAAARYEEHHKGCTLSADQSRLRRGLTTEGD